LVRNAVRHNGLSGIGITKLDVLGGLEILKICTSYDYKGKVLDDFPADLNVLAECKPIYEELPGWTEDISHIRDFEDLPANTRHYLKRIEELAETPIDIVSIGPGREETIVIKNPFSFSS
jgi:adenylosuccinate synthase